MVMILQYLPSTFGLYYSQDDVGVPLKLRINANTLIEDVCMHACLVKLTTECFLLYNTIFALLCIIKNYIHFNELYIHTRTCALTGIDPVWCHPTPSFSVTQSSSYTVHPTLLKANAWSLWNNEGLIGNVHAYIILNVCIFLN